MTLTSNGFFNTIHPDSGWISKYSISCGLYGADMLYTIAPLLSASSSEAETRRILVPILASCFTFSIYFWNRVKLLERFQWNGYDYMNTHLTIKQRRLFNWWHRKKQNKNELANQFMRKKMEINLTLSLTSVISTVNEHTPSRLGSPWSVAFTVTDTNLPSSPSRSNTLFVDTSPVSSSTVNFVPFWFGCWTIEYFTWKKCWIRRKILNTRNKFIRHSITYVWTEISELIEVQFVELFSQLNLAL